MTIRLLDISRWQVGLDLGAAQAAGYTHVNIALTGSKGTVQPVDWVRGWYAEARRRGMQVMFYHWLDNRSSGTAQATYCLSTLRQVLGVGSDADLEGFGFQVDCEDTTNPPTWDHWRDFVTTMQTALDRPIMAYTGDWWWTATGRKWNGAAVTPYLMAAPNNGYPGTYPGDASPEWEAGYGGWPELSCMQWGVQPIGGVKCSLAAIRDPNVWANLTGRVHPTMNIVTRAEWDARTPSGGITMTTWGSRTDFVVHYSAANKYQTVQAIQDYQMDTKGWSDIGYNFLVDYKGNIYEGRRGTWLAVGAHATGQNTKAIGVCCIGTNADITEAQKNSVRWLYDEACRRKGAPLAKRYHSYYANNPGAGDNNTSCPGDNLRNWVKAGMPTTPTEEEDVPLTNDEIEKIASAVWAKALTDGLDGSTHFAGDYVRFIEANVKEQVAPALAELAALKTALADLAAREQQAPVVNVDPAAVAQALIEKLSGGGTAPTA